MKRLCAALFVMAMAVPLSAHAFPGLYVSKTDASVFNQASKIVISRHDNRTVLTIAANFQGDVNDFALVIPVPETVTKGQVNVTENRIVDQLDAYTAPRLSEYYDDDPCLTVYADNQALASAIPAGLGVSSQSLGVKVEEQYAAGEYDITVLSAQQSGGLHKWLESNGYKIPQGADDVLEDYIKDGMKFFVAKVNLLAFEKKGYHYLRPIQVAYESEKFSLPLRIGALNASGPQDVLLMTLTQKGRVEPTNYRMTKLPSGETLPMYVAKEFDTFYKDMFARQVEKEEMKSVFLEYAWDMAWCDPCATDPMVQDDLITLGAWWLERPAQPVSLVTSLSKDADGVPVVSPAPTPLNAYVTRMHLRYTADTMPDDLTLQITDNRENFQARYEMRHPWSSEAACEKAAKYYEELPQRFEKEAQDLASLTGWKIENIRVRMKAEGQPFDIQPATDSRPWWEQMWEHQER